MRYVSWGVVLISLFGCNESSDRFEQVLSLRALGIAADTFVAIPNSTVNLTIHAAVPKDNDVTAEVYQDAQSLYAILVPDLELVDSGSYTEYDNFRHYQLAARFVVPDEDGLRALGWDGSSALLRYGVSLSAAGRTEKVVGDLALDTADSDAAAIAWTTPSISSVEPAVGTTLGKGSEIDLKAVVEVGDDTYKYGWFVSGGEIDNRRSLDTKWKLDDKSKQNLILTVRGKVSKAFSIEVFEYDAQ